MSKSPLIIFFLFLACQMANGQSNIEKLTIEGYAIDNSAEPLEHATIVLLTKADSSIYTYQLTDSKGFYRLSKIDTGQYIFQIDYLGFEKFEEEVIYKGLLSKKDMGEIALSPVNTLLKEVEILADLVPVRIIKDTIMYNANAFKVDQNANVEALLKKLPGIEVDQEGNITAQGETVTKIFVDGEEFFGNDPKIATKNLPADAIAKIKVFEDQTDHAKFTGIKDGVTERTINLTLKKDRKKGYFGKLASGYGSNDRYNLQGSLNNFNRGTKLSLLARLNNINQQGFSFNESLQLGRRNSSNGGRPLNTGVNTNGSAGINFNHSFNKKLKIRSSYFINQSQNEIDGQSYTQNYLPNSVFFENGNSTKDVLGGDHRGSLKLDYTIDSTQMLSINSKFTFGNNESQLITRKEILDTLNLLQSVIQFDRRNQRNQNLFSTRASYRKKFGKDGRNISINYSYTNNNSGKDQIIISDQLFYELNMLDELDSLRQMQNQINDQQSWSTGVQYTEPLGRNNFLIASLNHSNLKSQNDNETFQLISASELNPSFKIDTLSVNFNRKYIVDRGSLKFRNNGEKWNFGAQISAQKSNLEGQIQKEHEDIKISFLNVLPSADIRFNIKTGTNLKLNYSTSVREPNIYQLQPFTDNRNPINIYIGNPNLRPSYQQTLRFSYNTFNQRDLSSLFFNLNGTLVDNPIVIGKRIDDQFRTMRQPLNGERESRLGGYLNYSRPIFFNWRMSLNLGGKLSNSPVYLNNEKDTRIGISQTFGVTIIADKGQVFTYGFHWKHANTTNLLQENKKFKRAYNSDRFNGYFRLKFFKKWILGSTMNYNVYSGNAFANNQKIPILEGFLSTVLLPNDRLHLIISVFDILNQNQGIQRSSTLNIIEESRVESLGRYFMCTATYSFNKLGGSKRNK